jgi:shikimate kinase
VSNENVSGERAIILVGMMGTGKSTVGALLARRLGRAFVDTDQAVEEAARCRIRELFEREGEAGFRRRERAAIEAAVARGGVVALGGGAMAQPGMPAWLAERGHVIWLQADAETILSRVGEADERPLLAGLDPDARRGRLEGLIRDRAAAYGQAECKIDATGPPDQVVAAIEAALRRASIQATRDERA